MAMEDGRKPSRPEEDRARSLSRRICILIRNLAESFLRSPVVSYLILCCPLLLSRPWSSKGIRDVFSPSLPLLFPHPVLFLPHYTGLAYPGLWTLVSGFSYRDGNLYPRGRCQLRRRDATRRRKMNAGGNGRESWKESARPGTRSGSPI